MIIKTKKRKLPLFIAIATLLLIGSAVVVAAMNGVFLAQNKDDTSKNTIDYDKPTEAQKDIGTDIKRNIIEKDQAARAGSDTASDTSSFTAIITSAELIDETIYVRSEISGVYQTGTCTLTLTKGVRTVTKNAGLQPLAQSTTCKGFNIPKSELDDGKWNISLNVNINGTTKSDTASVTI